MNPNYATAHHWYGVNLARQGRFQESIAELKQALQIDPLDAMIAVNIGETLALLGRGSEALEACRKAYEIDPNFDQTHECFGFVFQTQSRYKEAVQEFRKAYDLNPATIPYAHLAGGLAKAGEREEALKIADELKKLSAKQYVPPVHIAMIYSTLGQNDEAFQWLETAFQKHDTGLGNLLTFINFRNLHSDPRFHELLKKIGLPHD